jgi:hypothetical protein
MPTDAYAAEPVTATQHRHPWLTQHDIDLAKVTTTHRQKRRNGLPVVISGDTRLKCCGLLVSELTPGATYPNA